MGLFLNLLHVPTGVTNDALEGIYKAMADGHDHGDDGIWKPHESPLIRRLIELFTQRGLDRLEHVQREIIAWESGHRHIPSKSEKPTPPGMMQRWDEAELSLVRLYLESLPPDQWSLSDHMMAVEFVFQRYLPADMLVKEADWLARRASMMGKVQANLAGEPKAKQADAILAAIPETSGAGRLSRAQAAGVEFASARAAESVRVLADKTRHRMRQVVMSDLEQRAYGNVPAGTSSLQTKLADEFATLNRDWRRIAVTEAGEAQLQGYIASLKPGTKVKRVERYDTACSFCKKIDGKVVTVVAADHPKKDPDTMIWPGKNNIGRSASPKKRVGNLLVDREPDELWTIPAGLVHPHCRGRWVPTIENEPGDDLEFAEELRKILGGS